MIGEAREQAGAGAAGGEASPRSVRWFGALLLALGTLAYRWAARHGVPPGVGLALGGAFALLGAFALAAPGPARPLYRAWMAMGHALGRVTTPVVLALVFALVFVPLRMLLRALGRDPLDRRFDRAAKSYWHERARPAASREDFERLT